MKRGGTVLLRPFGTVTSTHLGLRPLPHPWQCSMHLGWGVLLPLGPILLTHLMVLLLNPRVLGRAALTQCHSLQTSLGGGILSGSLQPGCRCYPKPQASSEPCPGRDVPALAPLALSSPLASSSPGLKTEPLPLHQRVSGALSAT